MSDICTGTMGCVRPETRQSPHDEEQYLIAWLVRDSPFPILISQGTWSLVSISTPPCAFVNAGGQRLPQYADLLVKTDCWLVTGQSIRDYAKMVYRICQVSPRSFRLVSVWVMVFVHAYQPSNVFVFHTTCLLHSIFVPPPVLSTLLLQQQQPGRQRGRHGVRMRWQSRGMFSGWYRSAIYTRGFNKRL